MLSSGNAGLPPPARATTAALATLSAACTPASAATCALALTLPLTSSPLLLSPAASAAAARTAPSSGSGALSCRTSSVSSWHCFILHCDCLDLPGVSVGVDGKRSSRHGIGIHS